VSRSAHPKDVARKLVKRERAAELRADGWKLADIATELGCSIGSVHNYLSEALEEANRRAGDLGSQIRAREDIRLLDLMERAMAMVDAVTGQTDRHGVPIDYRAATALGVVVRASESRRRLYGADAPAKVHATTFVPLMSDEEAARILAELDELDPI
jgi:transcriptional regulator